MSDIQKSQTPHTVNNNHQYQHRQHTNAKAGELSSLVIGGI